MHLECAYLLFICGSFSAITSYAFGTKAPVDCHVHFVPEFRACACQTSHDDKIIALTLRCKGLKNGVAPNVSAIFAKSTHTRPTISALSMTDGWLQIIGQDAFKGEGIQVLDLSANAIDTVKVNAFRGLENKLRELNLNRNELSAIPSWAFTYLHNVEHLHLRENRIGEVTPMIFAETQMKNLRYLHLDDNRISSLPSEALSALPLQVLTLSGNRIVQVNKNALPDTLWFLDLKDNKLTDIPYLALKKLKRLNVLDLEGNNITSISAAGAEASEVRGVRLSDANQIDLLLASNKIQQLKAGAFDAFSAFRRLDLSYNQINKISDGAFRRVERVQSLDLSYNFIETIPNATFSRFAENLEILSLKENHLRHVPAALRQLSALKKLNLDNNQLTSLKNELFQNFKLNITELSLAFNRLPRIPSDVLQGMHQLHSLDLSKNLITRVEKMAFGSFDGAGAGGVGLSLIRLNLAGNQVPEIADPGAFLYLSSLAHLDLSFNRIRRLTRVALERLESLESLFLHHNNMIEFPRNALSSLNRLRNLLLDHNQILSLPNYAFQWLVRLERLSLSHNRIHTLNAKTFHATSAIQVRWLNLGFNKIGTMHTSAFENLPNIEQLFLNNNRLTSLQPQIISSLRNLRHLTLAQNQINETQEGAFANLPHLESLSLAHNRLRTMKEGIFHRVPNLARLDLSHNRIESFDLDFLEDSVRQLTLLDLSHNVLRKLDVLSARKSLIKLEIQNNQLEYIDGNMLHGFEKLASVDVSHNDLIEVETTALQKSRHLEKIILAHNNLRNIRTETFADQILIKQLDLSANVLQSLDAGVFGSDNVAELLLSKNHFTSVPTSALASIHRSLSLLDLSYNVIRTLERRDFKHLVNVTTLNLSYNRIEALEDEVFREMIHLKYLDLSANPITTWSPHTFLELSPSIEWINLAKTGLFSLPKLTTKNLRTLNVSHNKIYELYPNDMENLEKLTSFDIAFNNLLDIKSSAFEKLQELKHLNLSGNGIRILHPEHFKFLEQLETLHMGEMDALLRIPDPSAFSALRHFKNFYIYNIPQTTNYRIQEIIEHLPPLKSLRIELKAEQISHELFKNVDIRLLRHLTISGIKIKSIEASAFERLRGFQIDLAIRDTSLREFSAEIVHRMSGVSLLNLALINNSIETLNLFANTKPPLLNQQGMILESIDLRGNPLNCDCRLEWLSEWINYYSADKIPQSFNAKQLLADTMCETPKIVGNLIKNDRKRESISLLDIYGKSHTMEKLSTSNIDSQKRESSNTQCDLMRQLISSQRSFKQVQSFTHFVISILNIFQVIFYEYLFCNLLQI